MKKNKTIFIILGVVVLIGLIFFFYKRNSITTPAGDPGVTEERIQREIAWIRNDPNEMQRMKDSAAKSGRTIEEELRRNAIWYVEYNIKNKLKYYN